MFAGSDHNCLVSALGHVACWGSNSNGQLGLGDYADRAQPTWISGLEGVTSLAMTGAATCALKSTGAVWCWGMNAYGELGSTTSECERPPGPGHACSPVPLEAGALSGVVHLEAGGNRFCAVLDVGTVRCWGDNPSVPPSADEFVAKEVAPGGYHVCFRTEPVGGSDPAGDVVCFGDNSEGKLARGHLEQDGLAMRIANAPSSAIVQVVSGDFHTCGLDQGGRVSCWGSNFAGSLGIGSDPAEDIPETCLEDTPSGATAGPCSTRPMAVASLPLAKGIAAGIWQTCAITRTGEVYCWGIASRSSPASAGACAFYPEECEPLPVRVDGIQDAVQIAVGSGHVCVVSSSDEVRCWGLNTNGQLGVPTGAVSFITTPVRVTVPRARR